MRPKVNQASSTSQSGACNLMEATKPAAEPNNNQKQANMMNMKTGNALDWSEATRSCISSAFKAVSFLTTEPASLSDAAA